jgi:hypothetical protein
VSQQQTSKVQAEVSLAVLALAMVMIPTTLLTLWVLVCSCTLAIHSELRLDLSHPIVMFDHGYPTAALEALRETPKEKNQMSV